MNDKLNKLKLLPSLASGDWLFNVGLPPSAQYAQVIRKSPHVSPSHFNVRLQLETASQMQPRQTSVTGGRLPSAVNRSKI